MNNKKIVNIIPATNIPYGRNQVYSYYCPKDAKIITGQEVLVPLRNKKVRGIITGINYENNDIKNIKDIIEIVDQKPSLNVDMIKLAQWISEYYYVSLGLVIKAMLFPRTKSVYEHEKAQINTKFPKLTEKQKEIYHKISESENSVHLIRGVTGSGKTEIYMKLIHDMVKDEKQSILLVPEISLTPQNIKRFSDRFGSSDVAVLHSRQTGKEKFTSWERIRDNEAKIIIGPRSAIFAPAFSLGLIIMDEEHDQSYKQYDQHPRYHAREVAMKLSEITRSKFIMGSATPSVEIYYQAEQNKIEMHELLERYNKDDKMPVVKILDMREEFKKRNFSIFSEELSKNIDEVLKNKKQALLFVNRRGAATFVMCRDCGHVIECPNCSVSLTFHVNKKNIQKSILVCHHCGYKEHSPTLCPKCNSQFIKFFGIGTQRVEQELNLRFPNVKVARMDSDTMQAVKAHDEAYREIEQGNIDIIIGTQMVTKGWDLPNIDLVGIISADTLFNFPDFRTNERAFQILAQVSGRTGRGEDIGKVILQTYKTDNFVINYAAKHDYKGFYEEEIKDRKSLGYPPFSKLIKLIFEDRDYNKVKLNAENAGKDINKNLLNNKIRGVEMLGPAPAYLAKVRNRYRWNIILKINDGKSTEDVLGNVKLEDCKIDIDPEDLL